MGGFVRRIVRTFSSVISPPPAQVAQAPVQAPVQAPAQTAPVADVAAQKKAALGSGYGTSGQTVLAKGGDEEANVSKTVLGQGKKKKIRA
jgi:hypothetical protein